ncbi:MAG: TonB-dependent receptor domain-containing protein [Campylobacteraceae bacterium]
MIKHVMGLVAISALCTVAFADNNETSRLNEIKVVTASGFEQNVADAPASISVITSEILEKKSYKDVTDALKSIPGVFVTGGGDSKDVSIRGMESKYTMYLTDGKQVTGREGINPNGMAEGRLKGMLPPLSAIDRIEVIRGPMSSLYGSDAMGGVINIITKKVPNEWTATVGGEYTLQGDSKSGDYWQSSAYVAGPLIKDTLALQLNGIYGQRDEDNIAQGNRDEENKQANAKLVWAINENNDLSLGYSYALQEIKSKANKTNAGLGSDSSLEIETNTYLLAHEGKYGDLVTDTYLQYNQNRLPYNSGMSDVRMNTLLFNTQETYFFNSHTLTFGGQYKDEELKDTATNGLNSGKGKFTRWQMALFLEDEWQATDDLAFTVGLRYNKDENFGSHFTPRVYTVYHVTDGFSLKGGISTGYMQPNIKQASTDFGSITWRGAGLLFGNPDLEPEKSINYELGFTYSNYKDLDLSLMLFHTTFKDKIAEKERCSGVFGGPRTCSYAGQMWSYLGSYENIAKAEMQGIEATFDYDISSNLKTYASYTYTRSEQKTGAFKGQPLNKMPRHMFNAGFDYQVRHNINTWIQTNFRSKTSDYLSRTSMTKGTPSYNFVDLGISYDINKNFKVGLGIYNILDKEVRSDTYGSTWDRRRYNFNFSATF